MREVTLIPKLAPVGESLPELNHGMFPQRLSSGQAEEKETPARTPRTPRNKAEKPETPAPRRSTRGAATPAAAAAAATPAAAGESTPTASGAGTPATDGRKGRPRGRYTRVSMPISTMEDLMNIQLAGGLGDVRRECAFLPPLPYHTCSGPSFRRSMLRYFDDVELCRGLLRS